MARVICIGKPYSPPVLNGFTFAPVGHDPLEGPPTPQTFWAAEVDEANFTHFCVNEEGSPFFLDADPRADALHEIETPGSGGSNDNDPFAPFAAAKNKADLVALAKTSLGLDLDETEKRLDLEQKIIEALAAQAPPPAQ